MDPKNQLIKLNFINGSTQIHKEQLMHLEYFISNERFNPNKEEFSFIEEEFDMNDFNKLIDNTPFTIDNKDILDYFGYPFPPVQLLDHQIDHVKKIDKILEKYNFYIDCSLMGCGKTFIALYIAQKYKLNMIVICPKSVINTWTTLAEEYMVNTHFIMSYQSFRSAKHGYLSVNEDGLYNYTQKLSDIMQQRTLVVFDEVQNVKNDSKQSKACIQLAKCALQHNNHTKLACLSATPFDKKDLCINLLYLLQIVKQRNVIVYDKEERIYYTEGFVELLDYCRAIDPEITMRYNNITNWNYNLRKRVNNAAYELFIKVLRPNTISSMKPFIIPFDYDRSNFYAKVPHNIDIEIKVILSNLRINIGKLLAEKKNINIGDIMSAITKCIKKIEMIKAEHVIHRLVDEELVENNKKIVIFANYYDTIYKLKEFFPNALQLTGDMSIKQRINVINKFQMNNNDYRVLIGNIKVGGTGVNLHDIFGNFPRSMYIIPSYSILDIQQATGRIYRAGTMSKCNAKIIYTKNNEQRLFEILANKGKIIKSITDGENNMNICSEFAKIIEN